MNAELNVAEGKALQDKPEMKEIRSTISNCLVSTKKTTPHNSNDHIQKKTRELKLTFF